jgi:hypothetical protein
MADNTPQNGTATIGADVPAITGAFSTTTTATVSITGYLLGNWAPINTGTDSAWTPQPKSTDRWTLQVKTTDTWALQVKTADTWDTQALTPSTWTPIITGT